MNMPGVVFMKRKLIEILACPMDKHHPLQLLVFEEKDEIVEGLMICSECNRYYPIIEEIPRMLPDDLRSEKEDLTFLKKWRDKIPSEILQRGKPSSLKSS